MKTKVLFVKMAVGGALVSLQAGDAVAGAKPAPYWSLVGNGNTVDGVNFLGTLDAVPLSLGVNNQRVMRYEYSDTNSPNLIGGYGGNAVSGGAFGATIGGGGGPPGINQVKASYGTVAGGVANDVGAGGSTIGGGEFNMIQGNAFDTVIGGGSANYVDGWCAFSTIAGGYVNMIRGPNGRYSTISGGHSNAVLTSHATIAGGEKNIVYSGSDHAAIGGGHLNVIQNGALGATIGGGAAHTIGPAASFTTIGGGLGNRTWVNANGSTIGGGTNNVISNAVSATIAGGIWNTVSAAGSTIGGGEGHQIQPGAYHSAIGGGLGNRLGAAGSTIGGGFVNRIGEAAFTSTIGGGLSNTVGAAAATIPGGENNSANGDYSFAAGRLAHALHHGSFVWGDSTDAIVGSTDSNSWTVRASGGTTFFSDPSATVGVQLAAGNSAWSPMSDRNIKQNFKPVDPRAVLEKVSHLPVTEWNLISQPASIRHIGPMAQDFQAAFAVGEDDKHISTTDADGVALAAIQGLNQKLEEQIKVRDARITALEDAVNVLKNLVLKLTSEDISADR